MKICLDIQSAIGQRAGVGRYALSLAAHLAAEARDGDELAFFYFNFRRRQPPFSAPNARFRTCRFLPGALVQKAWTHLDWPPFDAFAGAHDLFHFPNFFIPPLRKGRAVVTIHDVSFLRFPEFAEARNQRYLERTIRQTVARADAILTDSRFSAGEIAALLDVPPGRVHAVHLGVAPHMRPPPPETVAATRRRLGLERPYLLTVGTLEPRKNIPFLADVFEQLAGAYPGDLVLAGAPGWKVEAILARLARSPAADRIRRLDYTAEADLPALYAGADCFLCASHYEGFGLPPVEALACGAPVVSSPGGSLREVLGESAILLDPVDPRLWADRIRELLENRPARQAAIAAGFAQAARYTWPKTARQTWEIYRKVDVS